MRPRRLLLVDVVEVFDDLAVVARPRLAEHRPDDGHALLRPAQLRGKLDDGRLPAALVTGPDLGCFGDLGVADERLVARTFDRSELDGVVHVGGDEPPDEPAQARRGATLTRVLH